MAYIGKKPAQVDVALDSNSITAVEMAANSVYASEIANNAITAAELATNSIQALHVPNATALVLDGGLTVDNITIDGTEIDLSSGDLTIDVAGDINLDADGGDWNFKDGGTLIGSIENTSSDFVITSHVDDKDLIFKGQDSTSEITALTLDMSAAGAATFNDKIVATELDISGNVDIDGVLETDNLTVGGAQGSDGQVLTSTGSGVGWETPSSFNADAAQVFNESGAAVDFRIEGDTATNLFFVDGSADKIGINTSSPGAWLEVKDDGSLGHDMVLIQGGGSSGDYNALAVKANNGDELFKVNASSYHTLLPNASTKLGVGTSSPSAKVEISTADNLDTLMLTSTDADANKGPNLALYRNSASPADGDMLGQVRYDGENSAGETISYAKTYAETYDITDGTEDGRYFITTMVGGSESVRMYMNFDSTTFNESGADVDFRVESDDNANMLFVDGANDKVYIGASSGDGRFEVENTSAGTWTGVFDNTATGGAGVLIKSAGATGSENLLDVRNGSITGFKVAQSDGAVTCGGPLNVTGLTTLSGNLTMMSNTLYANQAYVHDRLGHLNDADTYIDFADDGITFAAGGAAAYITSSQKLYVGTSSPALAGTVSIQAENAGVPALFVYNTLGDSVGIRSQVGNNQAGNYIYYAVNSGGGVWQIRNDGDHQGTDTSIGSLSDSRLKKDVTDLTYDIAKFKQYRPIEFNWINPELHRSASGKSRGFLAQEVKALDEYYVDQYDAEGADLSLVDADKKAFSTKFGYKDAMYISVIKQLITRLETAEAKIAVLEG